MLDNRKFWKIIEPYFTNKEPNSNKHLLLENGKIAKNFNEHFFNVTSRLKLRNCPNGSNKCNTLDKLVENLNFILVFWK